MELLMHLLVLQSPMVWYLVIGGASLLVGTGLAFVLVNGIVKKKNSKLTA